MKRHTVKAANARLATKRGFDVQIVENRNGVFFETHQPIRNCGAVRAIVL